MTTTDLLSPRARRLLQALTPEPVAFDKTPSPEGMDAYRELLRFGLATRDFSITKEGIRIGGRYELRN